MRFLGAALAACLSVGIAGPLAPGAFAQDPGDIEPEEAEIKLFLSQGRGAPGDTVTLELGIITNTPIAKLSIALNFDESVLRFLVVRRHIPARDGVLPVLDGVDAAEFDNRNAFDGNQTGEGWIHVEVEGEGDGGVLDLPLNERVNLLDLDFEIRTGVPPGRTEVTFETVSSEPAFLGNEVLLPPDPDGGPRQAFLDEDDFEEGEIEIIGEVGFFLRADVDLNCKREITDVFVTLNYLFLGAAEPPCLDAADADDSGQLDLGDPVVTLEWLFRGGSSVPEPFTRPERDPTDWDDLDCADGLPEEEWDRCTLTTP